jgi:transposase
MLDEFVMCIRGFEAGIVALHIHLPTTSTTDFPEIQEPDLEGQQTGCADEIARHFTGEVPVQKVKTEAWSVHRRANEVLSQRQFCRAYMVHVSETCEPTEPHLLTHVHTTTAAVHEAMCTDDIEQALVEKNLPPQEHLVDAAYISAELLVKSHEDHGITLRGPTRPSQGWQTQVAGAYTIEQFTVDWERQQVCCPQGKWAASWHERVEQDGSPYIIAAFSRQDCQACPARPLCTQAQQQGRRLRLPPQDQYEALAAARAWYASAEGKQLYQQRAGIEGTLSQGVRAFGLRRTRYWGVAKTHLQHVAIAAAINIDRIVAWLDERPRAQTRTSRFAALAPGSTLQPGEAAA